LVNQRRQEPAANGGIHVLGGRFAMTFLVVTAMTVVSLLIVGHAFDEGE
jgi:hypothetical protein